MSKVLADHLHFIDFFQNRKYLTNIFEISHFYLLNIFLKANLLQNSAHLLQWHLANLVKALKVTPSSHANLCDLLKWGYLYSSKPPECNLLNPVLSVTNKLAY